MKYYERECINGILESAGECMRIYANMCKAKRKSLYGDFPPPDNRKLLADEIEKVVEWTRRAKISLNSPNGFIEVQDEM